MTDVRQSPPGPAPAPNWPVVVVDARPAALVAQLPGPDGRPYLTSQSSSGNRVHEMVGDTVEVSSYRVDDEVTVDADRTSAFVAVAGEGGHCLVVALNEGVVVRPLRPGSAPAFLGPHEAFLTGPAAGRAEGRILPAGGDHVLATALLDRVAGAMRGAHRAPLPVGAAAPAADDGDLVPPTEGPRLGHHLVEMAVTGVLILVVLVALLVVVG